MAGAVGKMMEGMLHMSDSQKAFSPWWEDLEGKLLYSLMILGKVYSTSFPLLPYCQVLQLFLRKLGVKVSHCG